MFNNFHRDFPYFINHEFGIPPHGLWNPPLIYPDAKQKFPTLVSPVDQVSTDGSLLMARRLTTFPQSGGVSSTGSGGGGDAGRMSGAFLNWRYPKMAGFC